MMRRVRRIPLVVALLACMGFASNASAEPLLRDVVRSGSGERTTAAVAEWGGPTVATNGESVMIYFSDAYPQNAALALQWADFMTSLEHGPELQTVSIHLGTLRDVQLRCGTQALACYFSRSATIYASAENPTADVSAKGALIHEFGHHLAASRLNPPFTSVDYGTKRWASYENVCARTVAGDLYPGAEDARHYMLNPGEAFAETYRVLNESRLGLAQEAWNIVTTSLYPDPAALSLLEQDISTPWTADTVNTLTAKLSTKVHSHTFTVSTPLDGTLSVDSKQSGRAKVTVSLLAKGSTVKSTSFSRVTGSPLLTTVCGKRSYKVRVRLAGTAAEIKKLGKKERTTVTLTVSTP